MMRDLPFDWVEDGDVYTAEIPDGRVVITQVRNQGPQWQRFGTRRFRLRIEYRDGTIDAAQHIFESFGEAEGWTYLSLQERDTELHGQEEVAGLLATLARCKQLLAPEGDLLHGQRLERIEEIIKKHYGVQP